MTDESPKVTDPYKGDPRALFAAERPLLAWQRSGIALMGFGFVIERFGLFLHLIAHAQEGAIHRGLSLALGVTLIVMGALANLAGLRQFRNVMTTLDPSAVPPGYWRHPGLWVSAALTVVAATLVVYFLSGA
jgi:putative membrane protein